MKQPALVALTILALAPAPATAQISLTAASPTATWSFDKTDGKLFPATVHKWTDDGTYAGWYAAINDKPAANYRTTNGGSTSISPPVLVLRDNGDEASLGIVRGESKGRELWGMIGVCLKNDTGKTITALDIAYTGKQWAQNTGGPDALNVQFSATATTLTQKGNGLWTDVPELTFTAPKSGADKFGPINGNAPENGKKITATLKPAAPLAPGATFWLRWTDAPNSGAGQTLAIDDFTITARTE
jgi:hypothetical protein